MALSPHPRHGPATSRTHSQTNTSPGPRPFTPLATPNPLHVEPISCQSLPSTSLATRCWAGTGSSSSASSGDTMQRSGNNRSASCSSSSSSRHSSSAYILRNGSRSQRRAVCLSGRPQRAAGLHIVAASVAGCGSRTAATDPRAIVVYDLSDQVVDYEQAWAWQRALLDRVASAAAAAAAAEGASTAAAAAGGGDGLLRGTRHALLLLQHAPVYTLGAGSTTDNLRFPPGVPPAPLLRTERGGEVTYHGPGQLVMYPILDLLSLKPDLHWYLRQLEQVVIAALDVVSGLHGERIEGLTGVWVSGAKVAAIGVRAKRWVSYHGLALNVVTDLAPFARIVPCGIADRPVTSVARLLAERAAEEDPFAPPPLEAEVQQAQQEAWQRGGLEAGPEGGGDDGMIPLSQATQEDLRRMLARTGTSPPGVGSTAAKVGGGAGTVPGEPTRPDLDDPFVDAATAALEVPAAGGGTGEGAEERFPARVRSNWSASERRLLQEYSCALLEAFGDVFELQLVRGDPGEL